MKMKKFFPVLFIVILIAAIFAAPVFALDGTPPVEPPAFDWSEISIALQTLLTAILVPVVSFAARWLFAMGSHEKSKLSSEQQYALDLFLKTCVYAAEQISLKEKIDSKLDYVLGMAEEWLSSRGIVMEFSELHARVEAIIAREFNMGKILAQKADTE